MTRRMLIDATHPEETRVVVVNGSRVEEFDYETISKKQIKGNIYLAKVTRVEPSLQAAFIEYGGNRHGFLAFSEIHPDYYQIPYEDRLALLQEEADNGDEDDDGHDHNGHHDNGHHDSDDQGQDDHRGAHASHDDGGDGEHDDDQDGHAEHEMMPYRPSGEGGHHHDEDDDGAHSDGHANDTGYAGGSDSDERAFDDRQDDDEEGEDDARFAVSDNRREDEAYDGPRLPEDSGLQPIELSEPHPDDEEGEHAHDDDLAPPTQHGEIVEIVDPSKTEQAPEEVGAQDALEELPRRRRRQMRRYKIQEVIKRRQIMLVQVVKEERGNKGAALTTYLSLAGRYCVLMPNTDRGGGISRKITSGMDRKRLKSIAEELEVPEGMGLIIRTAGANRTRPELKRDYEYLLRLWENVRELTLKSSAPKLVYEEGNLVKRSIRDLYGRDIDTVQVEGDDAYKEAKSFMRMLTPSHAKNVQQYRDKMPLFQRYQVESQLDQLFQPVVELRSGGYIVINATEALVAIDVNSGKATREHSIEETALKTNLEAAEEVARQLRLRDLAGLVVIDFIDMEEHRNNRAVERRLKDCLKTDRARIQVGRISAFGLLEMSRQRLRSSVIEGLTHICEQCAGTGRVPATETYVLRILRALEEEAVRGRLEAAQVRAPTAVALYLLNHKRQMLRQIEERFGLPCLVVADDTLKAGSVVVEAAPAGAIDWKPAQAVISPESGFGAATSDAEFEDEPADEATHDRDLDADTDDLGSREEPRQERHARPRSAEGEQDGERGRRRRRRRRRGDRPDAPGGQRPAFAGENGNGYRHSAADYAGPETQEPFDEGDADDGPMEAGARSDPGAGGPDDPGTSDERRGRRRRRGRRGGRRNRREGENGFAPAAGDAANGNGHDREPRSGGDDLQHLDTYEPDRALDLVPPRADDHDEHGDDQPRPYERAARADLPQDDLRDETVRPAERQVERSAERSEAFEPANDRQRPILTDAEPPRAAAPKAPEPILMEPEPEPEIEDPNRPRKKGWWQRRIFG